MASLPSASRMLQRIKRFNERMACFEKESPALMELLTKLHSAEKPIAIDHHLYEFGSVHYHVQASAMENKIIYLSFSTPPLSSEVIHLPTRTLEDIKRIYSNLVEVVDPPEEGFVLTLRLDFGKLPVNKEECNKAISRISSLRSIILRSQLQNILWSLGSDEDYVAQKPIKLVYHSQEPFFLIRRPEKITAIFPMRFKDDSDVVIAAAFFQELMDVGDSTGFSKAPHCTWSPIPPQELRGESFQHLTTNGGFVSFDIFSHHIHGAKLEKTVWVLVNFYAYVKYYVKCTRGHIHRKMRQRMERLVEVLEKTRRKETEVNKKVESIKSWKKIMKLKILKRRYAAFIAKIKRMRSRIRVKGLNRFRKRWLKVPIFASFRKYRKLDKVA